MLCRPAIVSYCLWPCNPTRTLSTTQPKRQPAPCRCRRVLTYNQMTDAVAEGQVMVYHYPQLVQCTLHRRYKRFLADVCLISSTSSHTNQFALKVPTVTAVAPAAVAASVDSSKIASADAVPAKRRRRISSCSSAASTAAAASGAPSAAVALGDAVSAAGATTVVHCPNTGSMMGLLDTLPAAAACSVSTVATRKHKHTLEMVCIPSSATVFGSQSSSSRHAGNPTAQHMWIGVHSALANKLVKQMLTQQLLPQLGLYESIQPEVKHNNSRFDFMLTRGDQQKVYVEVKSITMAMPCSSYAGVQGASLPSKIAQKRRRVADTVDQDAAACNAAAPAAAVSATAREGLGPNMPAAGMIALFPDAVSERAQRHVQELTQLRSAGHEAVCIFAIQRGDCSYFAPAAHIDPGYAAAVKAAAAAGVQMIAVVCEPDPESSCIWFRGCVPVLC